MTRALTRTALLAAASLALASCGGLSGNLRLPIVPERCSPAETAAIEPEPLIPEGAGIVAPCDPENPPIGVTAEQCLAERAATASYLASDAERSAWGRRGWDRAAQVKKRCDEREARFAPETNRAN